MLGSYIERILTEPETQNALRSRRRTRWTLLQADCPTAPASRRLPRRSPTAGRRRTGEMHLALASREDDPAFRPEDFSLLGQRP
ncbi:MAG: hypothetical protein R3A46_15295 [Thermomicrobiales bacterium]